MSKQFWGVIIIIVLVFVGIFTLTGNKSETDTKGSSGQATNHLVGKTDSKVQLIEYGDFQCPYCQQYATTVDQVVEEYKDRISFQFRNFPLVSLHQNAFAAARAAEAASLQGKFWEMHHELYSTANWSAWTVSTNPNKNFDVYAKNIGLDAAQFKKDFASSKVNDAVNADMSAGNKLGITGTPSFFLNGKKVEITNTFEAFKKELDAALAKQ